MSTTGVLVAAAVVSASAATATTTAEPAERGRVEAAAGCALTRTASGRLSARRGNLRLTTTLPPGGVISRPRDGDGSISTKLGWIPSGFGAERELRVAGRRLDAPSPPLRVLDVNWGYSSTGRGGWATPIRFPSEGCWRITATVAGIRLSYVTKVVAR